MSHVDDFTVTGKDEFAKRVVKGVTEAITVSKVEEDEFRFTGLDVRAEKNKTEVSIEEYADSVELVNEIRKADRQESLTKVELKEYRKYTGKISWLAQGTRPDLSFSALQLAKKNNSATISDLRKVNKVVEKIRKGENKVTYGRLGSKEKLQLVGIVDALYKADEKSVGGMIIMIGNEDLTRASPILWKSKQIESVSLI